MIVIAKSSTRFFLDDALSPFLPCDPKCQLVHKISCIISIIYISVLEGMTHCYGWPSRAGRYLGAVEVISMPTWRHLVG